MSFLIGGVDEVGRGALAGPIMAVAVVFKSEKGADWKRQASPIPGVNDSKSFPSHSKRLDVYNLILNSQEMVDFGVGEVSVEEINRRGIEDANRLAFLGALEDLHHRPNWLLVDGNNYSLGCSISQQEWRPKGDSYWWPVGAASILAKVIRDLYMVELGLDFPMYKWSQNAGYGTEVHTEALKRAGACIHHRKQFIKKILQGGVDGRVEGTGQRQEVGAG